MLTIPREILTSKAIHNYIKDLVTFNDATDFDSLDGLDQDKLVALAINALGGDIDITLNSKANALLAKSLLNPDIDNDLELATAIKESAHEQLSILLAMLIEDELNNRRSYRLSQTNKHRVVDQINGEVRYA